MRKQNTQQEPTNTSNQSFPIEIDAKLLGLVSGGAPRNTWSEPQGDLDVIAAAVEAPRNTW
jgi:hypothetical protein